MGEQEVAAVAAVKAEAEVVGAWEAMISPIRSQVWSSVHPRHTLENNRLRSHTLRPTESTLHMPVAMAIISGSTISSRPSLLGVMGR